MFSLQKGGVSAHFNGQMFGSCPIKESNSGIWLTKVKKSVSLLLVEMSDVQSIFFRPFRFLWSDRQQFIRRTLPQIGQSIHWYSLEPINTLIGSGVWYGLASFSISLRFSKKINIRKLGQTEAASYQDQLVITYHSTVYVLQNKYGWFEIGVSNSFRPSSIGKGMGNSMFWSELVKGLQGECAHLDLIPFESVPPKPSGSTVNR